MIELGLAIAIGFVVGLFFFGGLWWTVRRGIEQHSPGVFVVSFVVRFVVVGSVVFAFRNDWKALLLMLGGFIAARALVVAKTSKHLQIYEDHA